MARCSHNRWARFGHQRRGLQPGGVAERLIAPVLKTGRPKGLVSSNLTPSARSTFDVHSAAAARARLVGRRELQEPLRRRRRKDNAQQHTSGRSRPEAGLADKRHRAASSQETGQQKTRWMPRRDRMETHETLNRSAARSKFLLFLPKGGRGPWRF